MKLLVVTVNYRTAELTLGCLRSLRAEVEAIPGCRVVVVDNDSRDGSAERIDAEIAREGWSSWVSLLPSPRNGGFAYGNNLAIRRALASGDPPELVYLLNPDTIVRPGAVRELLAFAEEHPQAGILGGRLETLDGEARPSAFRFYSIFSELDEAVSLGLLSRILRRWRIAPPLTGGPQRVEWVCGASMLIRREVFETAGLFDEDYFLYFEEADFALQAHRKGWECWYVPASRVMHVLSAATQVLEGRNRRPWYWFQSRNHYFRKNHGELYRLLANVIWTLGFASWRVRRIVQRKPDPDPPHLLRDFVRFSFFDGARRSGQRQLP
jgi:hypothetical protein